jgi:hypothetical protein
MRRKVLLSERVREPGFRRRVAVYERVLEAELAVDALVKALRGLRRALKAEADTEGR